MESERRGRSVLPGEQRVLVQGDGGAAEEGDGECGDGECGRVAMAGSERERDGRP